MATFTRRHLPLPIATVTAVVSLFLAQLAAAPVDALKFNIDANDEVAAGHAGDTVFDDGLSDDGNWEYADRRLSTQPEPVCVEAEVTTGAFVFARLNRLMDGGVEEGLRCGDAGGVKRDWRALIRGVDACARLRDYDSRLEEGVDAQGPYCIATGLDSPRIRVENLYARKLPASTRIALLMRSLNPPEGHGGYEIRTESAGAVQGGSINRTVNYHGTARLWEFKGKAAPVAETFEFNVHMTFEKTQLR